MATIVYPQGQATVTIPANEKIAVFSWSPVEIYQVVGYPNFPNSLDLVTTTTAGEQYVSSAFASGATLQVNPSASPAFYEVGADPSVSEPQADITAADATFNIQGLAAAQGGYVRMTGGTSSTSGNAGGAAQLLGGAAGATGVGGGITITAAAGGATSGVGGAVTATGGAGTNGNSAGGAVTFTGGAGQGTAAGGVASLVGGASGAGATGNGANVALTGGASLATNGSGGSIVFTPGAKAGTGIAGGNFRRSATAMHFEQRAAQVDKADADVSMTAAEMINGIVVHTVSTGRTLTTPTGAAISAGCPASLAVGDCFYLNVITVGTGADDISTLTAGDGAVTFVGKVTVGPNTAAISPAGTFLFRCTASNTWVGYRVG